MDRAYRIDRADLRLGLRPPQKRPDGSVRYDAVWTRAGVFAYRQKDGSIRREYRSPEEVGRADSLASLELAHVTNRHPPKTGMAKAVNVGQIGTDVTFVDKKYVTASCLVRDDATNKDIDDGMVETSCGYSCTYVAGAGISPEGEAFDGLQTDIEYEHGAIVPKGRAGSSRLRTDEADWREDAAVMVEGPWGGAQVIVSSTSLSAIDLEATVRKALATAPNIIIAARLDRADEGDAVVARGYGLSPNGAPHVCVTSRELSLDALHATVTAALAAQDVKVLPEPTRQDRADSAGQEIHAMDEMKKKLDEALALAATEKARADAAEKEREAAKADATTQRTRADKAEAARDAEKERADKADQARKDAVDQAPIAGRARVRLEDTAVRILGKEFKLDGKPVTDAAVTDIAIKRAVTEKLIGKSLADATPAYVEVRFDVALEAAGESVRADADLRVAAGGGGARADETATDDAHKQMVERQRKAGDAPLARTS